MKRFRKLRVILVVIVVVGLASYFFQEESGVSVAPGSTLVIELEGNYVEASGAPWLASLLGEAEQPFASLLTTLAMAERDDRIENVVVVIRPLQIGWGKAGEVRAALVRLKEAGRLTVAYLDMAALSANLEYFIASAADSVYLTPAGSAPVVGLAANYFFLGGLWEMLGVTFDVGKAGKYKSAVESVTSQKMSPASEEMANSLLDSVNDLFLEAIMQGRDKTREEAVAIIDRGPMLGTALRETGLVDHVEYLDALLDALDAPVIYEGEYAQVAPSSVGFSPVASVALIYGTGNVVQGWATEGPSNAPVFASRTAEEAIGNAAKDPSIDAIILRIDSPGGSALASEQIWRSVEKARDEGKPIIASYSDMAASGGYYASVGADEIVSNPGTYTGSIGVFALRPVLGAALAEIGIESQSLTRGPHAGALVSTEPLTAEGRKRLEAMVLDIYDVFTTRVAHGRSLSLERVDEIAQGRVWTGAQAHDLGLVDRLGGLHEAVQAVREILELDSEADVALIAFPPPRGLAEELASLFQ
ncbi:MAG: signal peptide peptidase SppA, partial [Myxococcota bacterium]|nr:signal peptide peptidase SppA [Myxococcota bacterium]